MIQFINNGKFKFCKAQKDCVLAKITQSETGEYEKNGVRYDIEYAYELDLPLTADENAYNEWVEMTETEYEVLKAEQEEIEQ